MSPFSKIRHYCDHSVNFIMAVPFENPMVAFVLPLILSCAPGDDLAVDALRLSLLGVASVHQSFLLSRSQPCFDSAKEHMLLANAFRLKSKQTLARACATPRGAQSDAALGASLAISLMDVSVPTARLLVNVRKKLKTPRPGSRIPPFPSPRSLPAVIIGLKTWLWPKRW